MDKKRLETLAQQVDVKAYGKHGHKFQSLGGLTHDQYQQHFIKTLKDHDTLVFTGVNNRDLYYSSKDNVFSIDNMDSPDRSSHYPPGNLQKDYDDRNYGKKYFEDAFEQEVKRAEKNNLPMPKITTVGARTAALGLQRGVNAIGLYSGAENFVAARSRGDVVGETVAAANITSSLSNETLAAARALGKPLAAGIETFVKRGNVVATVADGAYQISQEQGVEHKLERGAAVGVTTAAGIGAGGLFAAGVGAGAGAVAVAVAAPVIVAGTVAVAADTAIELRRTVQALDNFTPVIPNQAFDRSVAFYPNLSQTILVKGATDLADDPKLAVKGIVNVNDPAWLRKTLTERAGKFETAEKAEGFFERNSIVPDNNKLGMHQSKAALAELDDYEKKFNNWRQTDVRIEEAAKNLTAKGGVVKDSGRSDPAIQNLDRAAKSVQAGRV